MDVYSNTKFQITVSWQGRSGKGPEEVKAHDGHPAEHRDADAVQGVAEGPAHGRRDVDEELVRLEVRVLAFAALHVVQDDEQERRQRDGGHVGDHDPALEEVEVR